MEMSKQEYQKYVKERAQSSPLIKDCLLAFAIGGGICVAGQLVMDGYTGLGLEKTDAGTATSITMVFLSVLLTGLNLYNKLARYGGAGTLVPITGFANAVASPAIDFKSEGLVPRTPLGGRGLHFFLAFDPGPYPSTNRMTIWASSARVVRPWGSRASLDRPAIRPSPTAQERPSRAQSATLERSAKPERSPAGSTVP